MDLGCLIGAALGAALIFMLPQPSRKKHHHQRRTVPVDHSAMPPPPDLPPQGPPSTASGPPELAVAERAWVCQRAIVVLRGPANRSWPALATVRHFFNQRLTQKHQIDLQRLESLLRSPAPGFAFEFKDSKKGVLCVQLPDAHTTPPQQLSASSNQSVPPPAPVAKTPGLEAPPGDLAVLPAPPYATAQQPRPLPHSTETRAWTF